MGQQVCADALLLTAGEDVGVADESDVANALNAHHAGKRPLVLVTPEDHTFLHFVLELLSGHVRFGPAIAGDDAFIGAGAVVDDGVNAFEVLTAAEADHECPVSPAGESSCCAGFCRRAATRPPAAPPRIFKP